MNSHGKIVRGEINSHGSHANHEEPCARPRPRLEMSNPGMRPPISLGDAMGRLVPLRTCFAEPVPVTPVAELVPSSPHWWLLRPVAELVASSPQASSLQDLGTRPGSTA